MHSASCVCPVARGDKTVMSRAALCCSFLRLNALSTRIAPWEADPCMVWIWHCRLDAKTDGTCESNRRMRGRSCRSAARGRCLRYVAGRCFACSRCLAYCVIRRCSLISACVDGSKTSASSSAFTSMSLGCVCYACTMGDGDVQYCDSV